MEIFITAINVFLILLGVKIAAKPSLRFFRRFIKSIYSKKYWNISRSVDIEYKPNKPALWLKIPDSKIDYLVLYDSTTSNMSKFPSLNAYLAKPEMERLTLISAHRDIHFRNLGLVKIGSPILLELMNSTILKLKVVKTEIVSAENFARHILNKVNEDFLVLATCFPFRYIGPAPKRFIVWSKLAN
jgi:sortase A